MAIGTELVIDKQILMKRYILIAFAGFSLLFSSLMSGQGNSRFSDLLETVNMKFAMPANAFETKVIPNDELNYQYAIKDTATKIEMRYLVIPLQGLIAQYNGPHDTGSSISKIDPNFLHTNLLLAYALKVEGKGMNSMDDVMPNLIELSHATADLEFNADWAAEIALEPCDEFGQNYKYCTIFEIHKDNIADAFVIYMYDNKDTFENVVKPEFHTLAFKK